MCESFLWQPIYLGCALDWGRALDTNPPGGQLDPVTDESTTATGPEGSGLGFNGLGLFSGYLTLSPPPDAGPERPGQEARGDGVTARGLCQAEEVQAVTGYNVHIREVPASHVVLAAMGYRCSILKRCCPRTAASRSIINTTQYKIRLDTDPE